MRQTHSPTLIPELISDTATALSGFTADDFFRPAPPAEVPGLRIVGVTQHAACEFGGGIMADLISKLAVNQLCGVIRQHGVDAESETMLGMLESLVIAGEIPFTDFIQRVGNLFPDIFSQIDSALLAKLSAVAAD
ncbi:MAG: hypothetical protein SFW64_06935 [Alphaproteobacteria bacterium]|nr:hypothetical protein [Alphaproteobacteria bacterium]